MKLIHFIFYGWGKKKVGLFFPFGARSNSRYNELMTYVAVNPNSLTIVSRNSSIDFPLGRTVASFSALEGSNSL